MSSTEANVPNLKPVPTFTHEFTRHHLIQCKKYHGADATGDGSAEIETDDIAR